MMTSWEVKGDGVANCNCSYGCPCQFNDLPTRGHCEAAVGFRIDRGHFGDVRLDGLLAAGVYAWPGPVHEGNGTMQLIVDERADERQRDALVRIMLGEETESMATMWWVYSMMCSTKLPTIYAAIDLDIDVDARRARVVVPGLLEVNSEPIRNPVTGMEHRVRIDMPNGFEYRIAEIGSGTTRATGDIKLELNKSYAQHFHLHLNNKGVVRTEETPALAGSVPHARAAESQPAVNA